MTAARPRQPIRGRRPVAGSAMLLLLALLTAIFWFADPAHRPTGHSRIDWPTPRKP